MPGKEMKILPRYPRLRAVLLVPMLVLVSFALRVPECPAADAGDLERIRAFMKIEMERWQVPGVGVGIVKDGEVVFAEGFGVRSIEADTSVDADTLFAIGSASKAFTTMDIGILVEEGGVEWDEPVRTYLPTFKLKDPVASERMTVRDIVSHRLGLGRHDAIWYGSPFSRDELFAKLEYLDFGLDFRDRFQYNNLGFLTAGRVVEEVSGLSWEAFTRQRIFEPLGMDDSNFSVDDSKKAPNHAVPHMLIDGAVKVVDFRWIDNAGPAGSINSSVNDVLKWVQMHLGKGTLGDTTIISEDGHNEMYTPVTALREPMLSVQPDDQSEMVYGLGWFIETYRGHKLVHHGGSIDGFYALILFMPNDGIGAVVLTNLGSTPLLQIAMGNLLDTMLDLDPVWPELSIERWEKAKEDVEKAKQAELEEEKKRVTGTRPSHPLADYAGVYEHPAYGVMTVELDDGTLTLSRNSSMRGLEHWHYDQFRGEVGGVYSDLGGLMVTFHTNHEGDVDRLSSRFDPTIPPIEFRRRAPEEM